MKVSLLVATCTAARLDLHAEHTFCRRTEYERLAQNCTGDWKNNGDGTCCTSKRSVKCTWGDEEDCKKPWHWLGRPGHGGDGCCLAHDFDHDRVKVVESYPQTCQGGGGEWKYLGNNKCVTTKRFVQCADSEQEFCKPPWDYLGSSWFFHGNCCLASDEQEVKFITFPAAEDYCKGDDWIFLGDSTCVTFKNNVTCNSKTKERCNSPWKYFGADSCCLISASMQSSTSVVAIILSLTSLCYL
eukprot:Skav223768  [mRNA]  locus=scaffold521:53030:53755:- [translate_table: standard]